MDFETTDSIVLIELRRVYPVRIPTACWLLADRRGMLDNRVRTSLKRLEEKGKIDIESGGWIICK